MKKLQLEQGTPEWHEFRKNHIGSSDAPIIMNLSPWTTPYQLWSEKLNLRPPQRETIAMKRGKELETVARQIVEELFGEKLSPVVRVSQATEWMAASLDASDNAGEIIVEIKCPGKEDHQLALNHLIPDKYIPQLQHQMAVCEVDFMYYYSFDGKEGKILKVYRDEPYIKNLIKTESFFWECLQTINPPPLNEKDHIKRQDPEWLEAAEEWRKINLELKKLENKEREVREYLIKLADNFNSSGNGVSLTKIVRKGTIDYERVPVLKGYDLEPFRKNNIESWRIGIN